MLTLLQTRLIFDPRRCCQCGVCLASCPVNALTALPGRDGMFQVACDAVRCIRCGRCATSCPAHRLPQDTVTKAQLTGACGIFLAHAKDEKVRWMASSGGVGRALLHHLLATRQVDAAYSLIYPEPATGEAPQSTPTATNRTPVQPTGQDAVGQWLTAPPPLPRIPGSLYRPIPWGQGLAALNPAWKRVLVIGLPCQLKGAKALLATLAPDLEIIAISLFCRQQKTLSYTRLVQRMAGCPQTPASMVSYRGRGWEGIAGTATQSIGYLSTTTPVFPQNLWRVPGCSACPDCLAATVADLTLADPWGLLTGEADPLGSNLVFAWTDTGTALLSQAATVVQTYPATVEEARRSIAMNIITEKTQEVRFHLGQKLPRAQSRHWRQKQHRRQWLEYCLLFTTPQSRLWRTSIRAGRVATWCVRLPLRTLHWGGRLLGCVFRFSKRTVDFIFHH